MSWEARVLEERSTCNNDSAGLTGDSRVVKRRTVSYTRVTRVTQFLLTAIRHRFDVFTMGKNHKYESFLVIMDIFLSSKFLLIGICCRIKQEHSVQSQNSVFRFGLVKKIRFLPKMVITKMIFCYSELLNPTVNSRCLVVKR